MKIASYLIPFLVVAVTVTSAKADLIDVIGEQVISTTEIGLFEAGNATTANGSVFFSGRTTQTGVVGGVQSYNTVTGQLSGVTAAQSLNGLGGSSGLTEIIRQNDGSILYVGNSALGSNSQSATYWLNDLSNPFSAGTQLTGTGNIFGASANGTYVGLDGNGSASFGVIGQAFQPLIGGNGGSALDLSLIHI